MSQYEPLAGGATTREAVARLEDWFAANPGRRLSWDEAPAVIWPGRAWWCKGIAKLAARSVVGAILKEGRHQIRRPDYATFTLHRRG